MSYFTDEIYCIPEYSIENPGAVLSGRDIFDDPVESIPMNDMHIMVVGAPGMGKTVQIRKIMQQTVRDPNSTHIIFDPKGEFCREFYREGQDHVLSLFDIPDTAPSEKWNLMQDAARDPHPETALREIAKSICKEAVEHSQNAFFPEAAESLLSAIWIMVFRKYRNNLPNNHVLIKKTKSISREFLLKEVSREENGIKVNADLYSVINELTDPKGGVATANIKQEMLRILDQVFNPEGNFCGNGKFSVIDFVRNTRGKRLFIVYDFANSESSSQIIGTLLNIIMKESLSINISRDPKHRTYYYLDELPVLPDNLTHLESLCCFGRSTGNRVIIGIQGLSQLYDTYGEQSGNAMLAAFTDNIIMRANDPVTVEKISRRSGQKTVTKTSMGLTRGSVESRSELVYAVPEDVMSGLDVGEAVISVRGVKPFFIKLDP